MANIKSSKKRILVANKKALLNKTRKSRTRTAIKKVILACNNNNKEDAKTALITALSQIDKATSKGIYHKNNASRKKSKLTKLVNSISA